MNSKLTLFTIFIKCVLHKHPPFLTHPPILQCQIMEVKMGCEHCHVDLFFEGDDNKLVDFTKYNCKQGKCFVIRSLIPHSRVVKNACDNDKKLFTFKDPIKFWGVFQND